MTSRTASLDRHLSESCRIEKPDRYQELDHLPDGPIAARGAGLSYVAASFESHATSVCLGAFDRILAFDPTVRSITVEAGISLGKLHRFLAPLGLCLPVQPGYPALTVGGCVAADVHGKNHGREGTFGRHVTGLKLLHPDHGMVALAPCDDLFTLTVGGLGLTGIIVTATLSLIPLAGTAMIMVHSAVATIEDGAVALAQLADTSDMAYGWFDFSTPNHQDGAGFITSARWITDQTARTDDLKAPSLDPAQALPLPAFNRLTMPVINHLYRWSNLRQTKVRTPLQAVLWPALGRENYFKFYGPDGFIESQILMQRDKFAEYIKAWRLCQIKHGVPVMLTTLKAFTGGKQSLLRYDGAGLSFTIDVANTLSSLAFLAELDGLNVEFGAVSSVMKDSRLSMATVRAQYGDYDTFRERLRTYDPSRRFVTALSRRLDL